MIRENLVITQEELQEYRRLKELSEQSESAFKVEKDGLLSREGEEVEPGPLTMNVGKRSSRSFSYDAMVEILGRSEADAIKQLLPEKPYKLLYVGPS
jgi:hypothetical protein